MADANPTPHELFGAFRGPPPRIRLRLLQGLAVLGVMSLVIAFIVMGSRSDRRVVTARGLRNLKVGMASSEVPSVLGRAFSVSKEAGGLECVDYGSPTKTAAKLSVYRVCSRGGKVVTVTHRELAVWRVLPDGTILPMSEKPG